MRRMHLLPVLLLPALFLLCAPDALADSEVRVPRLTGLELDEALRQLEAVGLEAEIVWTAEGSAGIVEAQRPRPGRRVLEGSVVSLEVPRLLHVDTLVPAVIGMEVDAVLVSLEDVYVIETTEVEAPPHQEGRIVSQDPRPGQRLPFRGVLRLGVGRAPDARAGAFPLPRLISLGLDEAEAVLLDLGLIPVPSFASTPYAASDQVLRQDPAATTPVTHGTRVTLQVERPHAGARRVRVPSLYGLDPAEAASVLTQIGLAARTERLPSRFDEDTVIRQQPAAGTDATIGSVVRLVVAYPAPRRHVPPRVGVPQLQGVELATAFALARSAGLRLDLRYGLARGEPGRILSQRPSAGVAVPLGTLIRVTLPRGVRVPDLAGLDAVTAAQRAGEAGLRIAFDGVRLPGRSAVVVSQTPEAGVLVAPDTEVRALLGFQPGRRLVLVPTLVGLDLDAARSRLRDAGLQGRFSGPPIVAGRATVVVSQDPDAGTRVPRGSTVDVAYRFAVVPSPDFVTVPELRGRTLLDARRLLVERGLVGVVSYVRGPGPKVVTGQSPEAGARVRRGSQVRFTIRQ